jgi:hypothetical protein
MLSSMCEATQWMTTHAQGVASASGIALCLLMFTAMFLIFRKKLKGIRNVYFDAQDFLHYEGGGGRELPISAPTGTFAPLVKSYIGITEILITVSAASIAFGGGHDQAISVYFAKVCLAFSILFGVLFCSTMLYRYEEYNQDVRSYTPFWYAIVESSGFTCLACFFVGYFVWALGL